jgi:hypothetical protein
VRHLRQFGESQPFETFDRGGAELDAGVPLSLLLDEFARVRTESIRDLSALNLRSEDLEARGRHPVFGVVTLSQLLAAWAAHDLTHLHQISRVMAHQYREAVGPWSENLGVLNCSGRREP